MAYWEAEALLSLFAEGPLPEFGSIYRTINNSAIDAWVKKSRERFGIKLLSRTKGFQKALYILRRHGIIGIFFDQNAGLQGALALLFDHVCSTTELPGIFTTKCGAELW